MQLQMRMIRITVRIRLPSQKRDACSMSNSHSRNILAVAVHLALGAGLTAIGADLTAAAAEPDNPRTSGSPRLSDTSGSTTTAHAESAHEPAAGDDKKITQLGKISVEETVSSLKVEQPSSPKYTEPLLDTAQTITVIPAELIQQEGVLLLRDVLRQNVPGITFGAGEGSSYGDSINIRGFSATNDIAVDGVRESANTTHTDPFDTQSIEVVQGTSSVYSGVGALGGTINLVSKLPTAADFGALSVGGGTADYLRGTADINRTVGDPDLGMAFRLNAMGHRNQVADRDVTRYSRWGVAPSFTWGLNTPTRLTLAYVHEHDRNLPEYGIPLRNFALVPGVSRSNYYGFSNVDVERIDSDALTAIFSHDFNDKAEIRNLTRWEDYDRYSITDAPEGRICFAPGLYPIGTNLQAPAAILKCGAAGANPLEGIGGPTYTPAGPIGNLRDTNNRIIANQTDLTVRFNTGFISHAVVVGAAVSRESYSQNTGNEYRNANGTTYLLTPESLYDPQHDFTQPINLKIAGHANL